MKTFGFLFVSIIMIATSQFGRSFSFQEEKRFISPPPHLEFFSFGYQVNLADLFWIRSIQDFDYCEVHIAKNVCHGNSWLAQMLDTIVRLSPDFQEVYRIGGLALSVMISDVQGASKLFEKGTRMFPNDFQLLYRAGYHALIEEKNPEKAAQFFHQAAKIQGTDGTWLYVLSSRLYTEVGQKEVALRIYDDLRKTDFDPGLLQRMREKLGIKDEEKDQ